MVRFEKLRETSAQFRNIRRRAQSNRLLAAAVAGGLAGSAWVTSAQAGNFTWDINTSGQFTTPTNWVGGLAPSGSSATDTLIFGGIEGATSQANADTADPFIINGLTLNSSALTTTNTIGWINSQGISLAGTNPFITQNGTGAFQIDAPLIFTSNVALGGTGPGLTTLTGTLSGAGSLRVNSGTWRVTNANNAWTGGTTIAGGTLVLDSGGQNLSLLGTGPTLLGTGGALNINAATPGGV